MTLPLQTQRRYNAIEVRFRAYLRPAKELQRNTNPSQTLTIYWSSPRKVDTGLSFIPSVRTPPGRRTPARSASAACCRRPRCTRRSLPAPPPAWQSSRVDQLFFQGGEEAFHRRVVPAVGPVAHASGD